MNGLSGPKSFRDFRENGSDDEYKAAFRNGVQFAKRKYH